MKSPYLHSVRWRVAYMGLFNGFVMYMFRTNINMTLPFMVKSTSTSRDVAPNGVNYEVNVSYSAENVTHSAGSGYQFQDNVIDDCQEVAKKAVFETKGAEFSWGKKTQAFVLSAYYYGFLVSQLTFGWLAGRVAGGRQACNGAEFSWDKKTQAFVLSAYYYGFLVSQLTFGWLVGRVGSKRVTSVTMLLSTILTLLVPVLARASVYALIVVRIALGFFTGGPIPAWYSIISQWALPHERSRFTGICWFGQYLGTIIGYFSSGFLCAEGFDNGWGSVFYIHGIIGVVFVVAWHFIVVDEPRNHPTISKTEVQQLTSNSTGIEKCSGRQEMKTPWRKILTHGPVLAVTVTHTLDCFVHYLVLICLPLYMKNILKFDIQSNGVFSSLPFISSAVGLFISGVVADHVILRKWLTVTTTRKLVQVTALLGTGVLICLPGFMTCSQRPWVIACLCGSMFLQASGYSAGYPASYVDIAPRFASMIFAFSNSFCTLSGILSPLAVAQLTTHDTVAEWRVIFFIATGCSIVGALVFGLFSSAERAPWAEPVKEIVVTAEGTELIINKPRVIGGGENGHITGSHEQETEIVNVNETDPLAEPS